MGIRGDLAGSIPARGSLSHSLADGRFSNPGFPIAKTGSLLGRPRIISLVAQRTSPRETGASGASPPQHRPRRWNANKIGEPTGQGDTGEAIREYRGLNTAFLVLTLQAVLSGGRGGRIGEGAKPTSIARSIAEVADGQLPMVGRDNPTGVRFNELNGLCLRELPPYPMRSSAGSVAQDTAHRSDRDMAEVSCGNDLEDNRKSIWTSGSAQSNQPLVWTNRVQPTRNSSPPRRTCAGASAWSQYTGRVAGLHQR